MYICIYMCVHIYIYICVCVYTPRLALNANTLVSCLARGLTLDGTLQLLINRYG